MGSETSLFQAGLEGTGVPPVAFSVSAPDETPALDAGPDMLGGLWPRDAKQAIQEHPRVWVWDGVLPTGTFNIVGAESKAGKTTLMRNLAVAVARGKPFLGRKTAQGTVLYLMLEDDLEEQVEFFEKAASLDVPVVTVRAIPPEFRDDRGNMLIGYLSECISAYAPSLVILDMFVNAFPGVEDFNNYVEVSRHMIGLIDLLREKHQGTAIVATHHMHKARRGESGTNDPNRILGSVAFNGRAYTQIMLDMKEHASRRYIATIQRGGVNLPRTPLRLDDTTLVLSVDGVGEDPSSAVSTANAGVPLPVRRAVSAVWRLSGGDADYSFTVTQICKCIGGRTRVTHEVENLRKATHAGWLIKSGAGVRGDPFVFALNPDKLPPVEWRVTPALDAAPSAPAPGAREELANE